MSNLSATQVHAIESVFEEIGLGIVATDTIGAVTFANPAAATLIGIEKQLIPIDDWTSHYGIHLSDGITICPAAESPLLKAVAGEESNNLEVFIQNHLGEGRSLWCTIDSKPIRDGDGTITGALLLILDHTERKRLAAEVSRSNVALQQFATVAAHDLQEPLRSIFGFTDMLAQYQENQLDEKSTRCMSKIKSAVTRMQSLINDLLSYSRIQTIPQILKPTDCNEIVKNCMSSLSGSIAEHQATVSADPLPVVMADSFQLSQLFQNLIGNAVKFCAADRPSVVQISAERQSYSWKFSVKDNGIGIAPEFADRVFRIFQRLHSTNVYSGTGIGLAICQTIVERHGGRIWLKSEPLVGTTFYFTIPAKREGGT